ncbi:MAG: hypothetical protein IGS03_18990 [Candidatus Sericytochromatia bacterium]|nr:hypothetical protein [Candidatus Sericytochromatia bacterium]
MSFKRRILTCLSLLLLSAGSALGAPLIELAPEARADLASGSFKGLEKIEQILETMSTLRALPVKAPVQVNTLNRQQLEKALIAQIERDIPPERIAAESDLYKHLGLLAPDFDYRAFLIALYTEQIGGYYDPKTRQLRLVKDNLTGLENEMLIAHELVHALQDQHFDLQQYLDPEARNDDRTLAQMALIEGDATAAATEFVQQRLEQKPLSGLLDSFSSLLSAARMSTRFETFNKAPAFIRESMLFPYQQGTQFVSQFRSKGWNWEDMAELYDRPPACTRHILHPQDYLNQIEPIAVSAALENILPQDSLRARNVLGELGYQQILKHHLDASQARAAVTGWRGDSYQIYALPGSSASVSQNLFVFSSIWQKEAQAASFAKAWQKAQQIRMPALTPDPQMAGLYQADRQRRLIWQHKHGVLILENLPDSASWLKQLRSDWQAQVTAQGSQHLLSQALRLKPDLLSSSNRHAAIKTSLY